MIPDTRDALDHGRDARQGPEIGFEAVRRRPLAQGPLDTPQLLVIEPGSATRSTGTAQRQGPPAFPLVVPAADTLPGDPQRAGDRRLRKLAGGEEAGRSAATLFHSLEITSDADG